MCEVILEATFGIEPRVYLIGGSLFSERRSSCERSPRQGSLAPGTSHLTTRSCSPDVQELKATDGVSCNVTYAESFVENKNVFELDRI